LNVSGTTTLSNSVAVNTTSIPICALEVGGVTCIHNGSPYAVANNKMQSGSLTIGGINAIYGRMVVLIRLEILLD
jgi:hypothetical protein